ncbi:MAG: hypothetical protein ACK4E4_02855, partial [Rhodocyclaceae bacterium]
AGGFPASGAKRRRIAFSISHARGCALYVFVMRCSIENDAAAQQTMVFMDPIIIIFVSCKRQCRPASADF